jgi:hypothetical protein
MYVMYLDFVQMDIYQLQIAIVVPIINEYHLIPESHCKGQRLKRTELS